jgi:hypothetical protein
MCYVSHCTPPVKYLSKKKKKIQLTLNTHPFNRVPHKRRVTETPTDPSLSWVGPTSGVRVRVGPIITVRLRPAHRFRRQHPLDLQTRLGPPVHGQGRIQVHKARVSATPGLPDPDHVRGGRPARPERTTQRCVLAWTHGPTVVDVHVAETR